MECAGGGASLQSLWTRGKKSFPHSCPEQPPPQRLRFPFHLHSPFLISVVAVAFSSEQTQEAVPSPKIGSLPRI